MNNEEPVALLVRCSPEVPSPLFAAGEIHINLAVVVEAAHLLALATAAATDRRALQLDISAADSDKKSAHRNSSEQIDFLAIKRTDFDFQTKRNGTRARGR